MTPLVNHLNKIRWLGSDTWIYDDVNNEHNDRVIVVQSDRSLLNHFFSFNSTGKIWGTIDIYEAAKFLGVNIIKITDKYSILHRTYLHADFEITLEFIMTYFS